MTVTIAKVSVIAGDCDAEAGNGQYAYYADVSSPYDPVILL